MSVLRSKRHISDFEFEHTFSELYKLSRNETTKIAKRRKKWICKNIDTNMNKTFNLIMEVNEGYYPKDIKEQIHEELIGQSIDCLINLEKPLMILWNVEQYRTKKMVRWVDLINYEIALLSRMISKKKKASKIMILDWKRIDSVVFLKTMSNLHRYVHGKVVNAKSCYDDTESSMLIQLIDEAFYSLIVANKKIPETKEEYEKRRENISVSISCLRKMNRPMTFYFNTMQYSERVMREWSSMLSKELKLLYSLQKSDKERFKHLK